MSRTLQIFNTDSVYWTQPWTNDERSSCISKYIPDTGMCQIFRGTDCSEHVAGFQARAGTS